MKKNENVILSNEIEIINGVEVDWSKYKGVTSGRHFNRVRNSYVGLCELLQKRGHTLESGYTNATTKIYINFNCGHPVHDIKPSDYKSGCGCPICAGNSPKYSKQKLFKLAEKKGHSILGEYVNNSTPILIDFKCGHPVHNIKPSDYKRGQGCPMCARENIIEANERKSKKAKLELYKLIEENGHTILGEYINALTPILIDFNCGHKPHSIRPYDYKNGTSCPECHRERLAEVIKRKSNKAELELYKLAEENGHTILGEYINTTTKILIDFRCGHKPHKIKPSDYKTGHGCPICKASKGEKEVARILKDMNINYQEQYKFEDCKCVNPLPFDFYIPQFNICIEYDGEFHYKTVRYRKKNEEEYDVALAQKIAEERLKETQRRDKIKTDYCKENGINLIRIPYWEFDNIESILKKELSKYTKKVA